MRARLGRGAVDVAEETRLRWPGYEWVPKCRHAGARLVQRDLIEAGLLERGCDRTLALPPQPIEVWNRHRSDMNRPYSSGRCVRPVLVQMAGDRHGIGAPEPRDPGGSRNDVCSEIGPIPLDEARVPEGERAFRATVERLVARG